MGLRRWALATILGLGWFASPAQGRAQARELHVVRFATLAPSALLWTHAVANAEGFYAKHGLKVEDLRAGSSTALLQAVATGSADAGASLGDAVIRAVDQGAPVVIAGAMIEKSILRLVVAKGVKSLKELDGAPVTAGAVQGGTANLLRYQLKEAGVDPNSLKMISITNSKDRVVALENGQVKAALLIAPFDVLAERQGMKVLGAYQKPYIETPLIFNKPWAARNRPTADAMTQALKEASDWIYDPANEAKAIDILAAYTSVPRDVCAESYKFIVQEHQAIGRGLRVQPAGLENIVRVDEALGAAPVGQSAKFDLSKYFDPSFLAGR